MNIYSLTQYVTTYSRWRTAAILKIVISPISAKKSSDKIWRTLADYESDDSDMTKNKNF